MERSAYEALMIGVNITIFIVALTAAITLMSSLLNMSELANEAAIQGMNGTIAESIGEVKDQIYTGRQLLTYYGKIKNQGTYELNYEMKVKLTGSETLHKLSSLIENNNFELYIDKDFVLEYRGKTNEKYMYVLVMQE